MVVKFIFSLKAHILNELSYSMASCTQISLLSMIQAYSVTY